ncbi:asparagine synthase-related protein [Erythrobacter sp. F6033]|uniref:asparagine synthetase B family protein n=1 Tax=Erythrobacter sp. F6033 TaxID=2926401 RepID=UPI001FF35D0E|nr:asparagine synthase-related protein [Erythrobacter sp. F6033]MCK0127178.1 asparagine synthase-related protein [Erythrobacter sp. F6033]
MTGIAAIFAEAPSTAKLGSMIQVLAHNPHDTSDNWSSGKMALAACRLPTSAEALEASQPYRSTAPGLGLVFDGFLTNCEELRRDLKSRGVQLRNRSDEELVIRSYEQWGEECASRIEGEFAFVVADCRRQTMFCARDHQGLRPLFYSMQDGGFIAGSSVAVVLAALGKQPDYDYDFLAEAMVGEIHSVDRTPWDGIKRVPSAHSLSFSPERTRIQRYYSLPASPVIRARSDRDFIEEYREVLRDAVRRTSRTNLPLAIEVSGGLDSSAVYCLAVEMARDHKLLAPEIRAFTLRGEARSVSDEVRYARAVTEFTNTDLREYELFRPDLDWFEAEGEKAEDLPTYTNAAQSILMAQSMVANGSRVFLNGVGGDQWLDGSHRYFAQAIQSRDAKRFLSHLRRDIEAYGVRWSVPFALKELLFAALPTSARLSLKKRRGDFGKLVADPVQFLDAGFADRVGAAKLDYFSSLPNDDTGNANARKLDACVSQSAFDLMARQHARLGLESRSPMLTRQFIEFTASVPEDLKLRGGQTKWLHREAMRGLMPDCVVDREDKASFPERKHDREIRIMCEPERNGVLQPLVDPDAFRAFCAQREEDDIDDLWGWQYWGIFRTVSFLRNAGVTLDAGRN